MIKWMPVLFCTAWCLFAASWANAEQTPDFSMTAAEYHEAFEADKDAARKKYLDKTIELTGTISVMTAESDQVSYLMLDGGLVGCFIDDPQPWSRFGTGQKVRVRGTLTRRLLGIGLERCTLTAVDKSPLIKRSAVDLAREFKKDWDGASDKYDEEQLLVSGKISKVKHEGSAEKSTSKV